MNKIKYYQQYTLHMKNGDKVEYYEDYDLSLERGIVGKMMWHSKEILSFGEAITYYVPLENIEYITACGVKKVV